MVGIECSSQLLLLDILLGKKSKKESKDHVCRCHSGQAVNAEGMESNQLIIFSFGKVTHRRTYTKCEILKSSL